RESSIGWRDGNSRPRPCGRRMRQRRDSARYLPLARPSRSLDDLELLEPAQEEPGGGTRLLVVPRPFERVQNLVALIDAGTWFVLAHEGGGIIDVADDAPVDQPDLRREVE